jgi:hypothetical protein
MLKFVSPDLAINESTCLVTILKKHLGLMGLAKSSNDIGWLHIAEDGRLIGFSSKVEFYDERGVTISAYTPCRIL